MSSFQQTYQDSQTLMPQNINCHSSWYDAHPLQAQPTKILLDVASMILSAWINAIFHGFLHDDGFLDLCQSFNLCLHVHWQYSRWWQSRLETNLEHTNFFEDQISLTIIRLNQILEREIEEIYQSKATPSFFVLLTASSASVWSKCCNDKKMRVCSDNQTTKQRNIQVEKNENLKSSRSVVT